MDSLIKVENVCFKYANKLVLEEISLNIEIGEFVGIVGKNGSGKSTLLKLILGQLKPICGDIVVKRSTNTGYVEQVTLNSDISFPATVYEIVMLGLYKQIGFFKLFNVKYAQKVHEALKMVGLEGFEKKQLYFLSGGEQQRVMIAKALVSNPELLILDEPTTGIDVGSEQEFMKLLHKLNKTYKKTIIMVTHNMSILKDCDKIYELDNQNIKEIKNV
ncbi:MAG: metal ABC transporter ATP-binding protein [Clostridia bacterium]|jgi:zinc transport system ATP-binding protein|nr:metal ABC transporter ATP-binding protein [Clostridia bacterium]